MLPSNLKLPEAEIRVSATEINPLSLGASI